MLPSLSLARLHFTYRLQDALPHAATHGSLWRWALGYALKLSLCIYTDPFQRPCAECMLHQHCAYPPLFEPIVANTESASTSDDAARPFVLEPPLHAVNPLRVGEEVTVGLVIMGPALLDVPALVRAGALLGVRGLGKSQAKAKLVSVDAVTLDTRHNIWPHGEPMALPLIQPHDIATIADALPSTLLLHFVTPTRLKRDRQVVAIPDAVTIVRALLRRLISLAALYGEPWYPDTHTPIQMAATLPTEGETDWRLASHISTRQKQRIPLDGFEGALMLHAVPPELRALLLLGSLVHIGKMATYGHGWYLIELLPAF